MAHVLLYTCVQLGCAVNVAADLETKILATTVLPPARAWGCCLLEVSLVRTCGLKSGAIARRYVRTATAALVQERALKRLLEQRHRHSVAYIRHPAGEQCRGSRHSGVQAVDPAHVRGVPAAAAWAAAKAAIVLGVI